MDFDYCGLAVCKFTALVFLGGEGGWEAGAGRDGRRGGAVFSSAAQPPQTGERTHRQVGHNDSLFFRVLFSCFVSSLTSFISRRTLMGGFATIDLCVCI